jgi:hypothetical protein
MTRGLSCSIRAARFDSAAASSFVASFAVLAFEPDATTPILQLLNKAANVAEQNSKHAIDMAQKLAHELRAAQQRISELEAEGRGVSEPS